MKNKILVVDGMFPNKFAIWRNFLISDLIKNYDVDIAVYKLDTFAGIDYNFDYEFINSQYYIKNYNIIICNEKYAYIQRYNVNFNGLDYLNKYDFSYAFIKNKEFNISDYDLIFYIFLNCYKLFKKNFNIEKKKNLIYLLAGGGFNPEDPNIILSNSVNYISSTQKTTEKLLNDKNKFNFINIFGVPMFDSKTKMEEIDLTRNGKRNFSINFSSMGHANEKGFGDYIKLARYYKIIFPFDKVDFKFIGNLKCPKNIKKFEPTDYKSLIEYYKKEVDVHLDLQTYTAYNGWPLGVEALLGPGILISKDNHNLNLTMKYGDKILIHKSILQTLLKIRKLYKNAKYFSEVQNSQKLFLLENYGYKSQQERIFEYINKIINKN